MVAVAASAPAMRATPRQGAAVAEGLGIDTSGRGRHFVGLDVIERDGVSWFAGHIGGGIDRRLVGPDRDHVAVDEGHDARRRGRPGDAVGATDEAVVLKAKVVLAPTRYHGERSVAQLQAGLAEKPARQDPGLRQRDRCGVPTRDP